MNLTAREALFVKVGAVTAIAFLVFLFVLNPIRRKWSEARGDWRTDRAAFLTLRESVNARLQLDRSIENLEKKLAVKCQKGSVDEQKQAFLGSIEQTAGKCKVNMKGLVPRSVPGQKRKATPEAGDKIAYSMTAETNQEGLLKFLKALDELEWPVTITNFEAKTEGKDQDKIQIALDFHSYLFDGSKP